MNAKSLGCAANSATTTREASSVPVSTATSWSPIEGDARLKVRSSYHAMPRPCSLHSYSLNAHPTQEPMVTRCLFPIVVGPRPYLMFTNRNSIRLIMTNGMEYKRAFNNLHDARALGFDIEESMVYWTDGLNASIQRAKLAPNSKIEQVVRTGIVDPSGLAIDWVGKKIYWTDSGSNSILVSEMNGQNKMTLISSGVDKPSSLVVDPSEG